MRNTFFQLISIELLCLFHLHVCTFYRLRQFAAVVVVVCLILFSEKKETRNSYSGRWGDMFRHYVAITIDARV